MERRYSVEPETGSSKDFVATAARIARFAEATARLLVNADATVKAGIADFRSNNDEKHGVLVATFSVATASLSDELVDSCVRRCATDAELLAKRI